MFSGSLRTVRVKKGQSGPFCCGKPSAAQILYPVEEPDAADSRQAEEGDGVDQPLAGGIAQEKEGGHVGRPVKQEHAGQAPAGFGGVGQQEPHAEAVEGLGGIAVEDAEEGRRQDAGEGRTVKPAKAEVAQATENQLLGRGKEQALQPTARRAIKKFFF